MFSLNNLLKPTVRINLIKRFKKQDTHWAVIRKKKTSTDKALEHFNDFYNDVFKKDWVAIKQGLLAKQRYVAVVNNYSDSDEISESLERIGAVNLRTMFQLEKKYITENNKAVRRKKLLQKIWKDDNEKKKQQEQSETVTEEFKDAVASTDDNAISIEEGIDLSRVIYCNDTTSNVNLYQFIPTTKIKGMEDFIPESAHYSYYENSEFPIQVEKEYDFHFPPHLNIYCFDSGNFDSAFLPPRKGSTGVYNYYLMDGGSVFPVLALDLKPGNHVLDMCSAPGGKSFLCLQSLLPERIVCNDVTKSRVDRVYTVMREYLYDLEEKWISTKKLSISLRDGRNITDDYFDRIIVDVPCTVDRHSLHQEENNIFKSGRIKERLRLPELQSELLVKALKLVKEDGIVVYSTCSLSPIQNDGVVHMSLKKIWEESKLEFKVMNLSPALTQVQSIFKVADTKLMRYGHLILPNLTLNYGPTYFCKLKRIK